MILLPWNTVEFFFFLQKMSCMSLTIIKHNTWQFFYEIHEYMEIKPVTFPNLFFFLPRTVIIKHKYDNEARQETQTGEVTVNISTLSLFCNRGGERKRGRRRRRRGLSNTEEGRSRVVLGTAAFLFSTTPLSFSCADSKWLLETGGRWNSFFSKNGPFFFSFPLLSTISAPLQHEKQGSVYLTSSSVAHGHLTSALPPSGQPPPTLDELPAVEP